MDAFFQTQNPSDRDFIISMLDYTLGFRQQEVLSTPKALKPKKEKSQAKGKHLNIIAGIDGSGKTTFYHAAKDLFTNSHYIEKKRHALYKACERYFQADRSLTIEAKLTVDDTDLLPIIKLAQDMGYLISVYVIEVDPVDIIHKRLSERDGHAPFSPEKLAAIQFYSGAIINDLLNEADRFMVINNNSEFKIAHLNWPQKAEL